MSPYQLGIKDECFFFCSFIWAFDLLLQNQKYFVLKKKFKVSFDLASFPLCYGETMNFKCNSSQKKSWTFSLLLNCYKFTSFVNLI